MRASICIWGLALFFGTVETAHYGWNMAAKSDAEMICDGIALVIFALAFATSAIEKR